MEGSQFCPHCGKDINKPPRGRRTNTTRDPLLHTLITYFQDRTLELHGFIPEVDTVDYRRIKDVLKSRGPDDVKAIIDWFLASDKAKQVGITCVIALSKHSINEFEKSRTGGSRADEIRRALGVRKRGAEVGVRGKCFGNAGDIQQEEVIIEGRNLDVDEEARSVPKEGAIITRGIHRPFFK